MRCRIMIPVGLCLALASGCLYNPVPEYGGGFSRVVTARQAPIRQVRDTNLYFAPVAAASSSSFRPVPLEKLSNYRSLKKKQTDAEFRQAYAVALEIVTPLAGLPREQQLAGIAQALRARFDAGGSYSTSTAHYNDPYGYLVLGVASCAGCTRATGLCLNILGIPYEHVNENKWTHQWCRVNVDGTYWITDAFGLYVGPEPAPYRHPRS